MKLIGDPHLGREFLRYVPLDRRGDREDMMMAEFTRQLNECPNETTVIVGDLFEKPIVSQQVLYDTINAIIASAMQHPTRKIIILAGNHDLDKAIDRRGSFHLLAVALERVPNVRVLFKPEVIDGVAYFPWEYERTAEEQVNDFTSLPSTAVGHWDLESFGGSDDHLCPASRLHDLGANKIYSGHWHIAGLYSVSNITVVCTGSMQPMTHAEDPKGEMYVTLTKEEYEGRDPKDFVNHYVRVYLEPGEEVSPPPT
jgi:DNA repair exonuclease SbcCD nuclease subunit